MTSRPGFWGKALPERYVDQGVLFCFYFTPGGDVMLNVDGSDKGVFLTGLDSRTPLYVMVDIYGNTTAVQLVGESRSNSTEFTSILPKVLVNVLKHSLFGTSKIDEIKIESH